MPNKRQRRRTKKELAPETSSQRGTPSHLPRRIKGEISQDREGSCVQRKGYHNRPECTRLPSFVAANGGGTSPFTIHSSSTSNLHFIPTFAPNRMVQQQMTQDKKYPLLLGIESSCDDTSAAVVRGCELLSNVIASQAVHSAYGGVVPEMASRAHQQNIVPVVSEALKRAGVSVHDLDGIAFTAGPGLLGSLLVGVNFTKGLHLALGTPLISVNHLRAHVLAHFIYEPGEEHQSPEFPFLCLLVSGGNSQIIKVNSPYDMEVVGQTIDDAAGEAFDKCAKVMGLGYPGGPVVNKLANEGNPLRFQFSKPQIKGLDYSFSGLKTSFLYTLRDELKENPNFIEENKADLCASLQKTVIDILMGKLLKATKQYQINRVAVAGGVSANTGLRDAFHDYASRYGWKIFIPKFAYTTDNAAMVAAAGYFSYLAGDFASRDLVPFVRTTLKENL